MHLLTRIEVLALGCVDCKLTDTGAGSLSSGLWQQHPCMPVLISSDIGQSCLADLYLRHL